MKVLNDMEVGMVSGGVCEEMSLSECITDFSTTFTGEVADFFAGLNQLGGDLGIWTYNYIHGC